MKIKKIVNRCPVCHDEMLISELTCKSCGTIIKGTFKLPLDIRLSTEDLHLLLLIVKHMANLSLVAKEMGISYPTLKNKMLELKRRLGFEKDTKDTLEVLERINKGEIDVDTAIKILKRRRNE